MHPRYFIGITLPNELSDNISQIQRELFIPGKAMEPLVPHITLLDPNVLQTLSPLYFVPKIKEIANQLLPAQINLTGTDIFHDRNLYLSVDSSELVELQAKLASLLPEKVRAQYYIGRTFTPHVTLVQMKPSQKLPAGVIDGFRYKTKSLLPFSFSADHLTQFIWQRPREYTVTQI